jgi:hypothetical protein
MEESRKPVAIALGALGVVFTLGWIGMWQLYKHNHHHWMALTGYLEILAVLVIVVIFARSQAGLRREIAVAAALFAVPIALGKMVGWASTHQSAPGFMYHHNHGIQTVSAYVGLGLVVVVVALVAYRWIVRTPMVQAGPHLVVTIGLGALIASFAYFAASRSYPFQDGAGQFFLRIWYFLGAAIVGVILGYLFAVAMGRDYRSRGLQALAAKARTPVKSQSRPGGKARTARR